MKVCALSPKVAALLENHGQELSHRCHVHLSRKEAEEIVRTRKAVWMGEDKRCIRYIDRSGTKVNYIPLTSHENLRTVARRG